LKFTLGPHPYCIRARLLRSKGIVFIEYSMTGRQQRNTNGSTGRTFTPAKFFINEHPSAVVIFMNGLAR